MAGLRHQHDVDQAIDLHQSPAGASGRSARAGLAHRLQRLRDGGGVQPPAAKMCLRNSWYRGSVASPNGGSCRSGAASLTAAQSAGVSSLAAFFFLEGA